MPLPPKKPAEPQPRVLLPQLIAADGKSGALVEVNSETDFVAKTEKFQAFVADVTNQVLVAAPADNDALFARPAVKEPGKTVQATLNEAIAVIGENLQIRRFARFAADGYIGSYIHGGGKIGVLVLNCPGNGDLPPLSPETSPCISPLPLLAIHPRREEVSADVLEREKDIYRDKARQTGKPENIIEKIIEGQIGKFYGEVCLLEQSFVSYPDKTIQQVLKSAGPEVTVQALCQIRSGRRARKERV